MITWKQSCWLGSPLCLKNEVSPLLPNLVFQRLTHVRGTGLIGFGSIVHILYIRIWRTKRRFGGQPTPPSSSTGRQRTSSRSGSLGLYLHLWVSARFMLTCWGLLCFPHYNPSFRQQWPYHTLVTFQVGCSLGTLAGCGSFFFSLCSSSPIPPQILSDKNYAPLPDWEIHQRGLSWGPGKKGGLAPCSPVILPRETTMPVASGSELQNLSSTECWSMYLGHWPHCFWSPPLGDQGPPVLVSGWRPRRGACSGVGAGPPPGMPSWTAWRRHS